MSKALYRKYRSKSFDEVVGQDHITKTLKNSLASGKISHAYLLSGPRGVGKTSVARILAYEVNNLAYDEQNIHLDIIEIDAASNRRIEEIRDLRDKVHIAPTSAKYKVYIIDEAHMLTKEAFNALLKTLEEPPEHCIFILATTEPHKLPETIISRTQRFNFKAVDSEQVAKHLKSLANKENIKISDQALVLLAEYGHGSFRDSISLLDQLRAYGQKIDIEDVENLLGIPSKTRIDDLSRALYSGSINQVSKELTELKQDGYDPTIVARLLIDKLRQNYLEEADRQSPATLVFLKRLLKTPTSTNPSEYLEICCLQFVFKTAKSVTHVEMPLSKITEPELPKPKPEPENRTVNKTPGFSLDSWQKVLDEIKQKSQGLYAVLRLAKPDLSDNKLHLLFSFNLHKQKASNAENKHILSQVLKQISDNPPEVEYRVDRSIAPIKKTSTVSIEPSASSDNNQTTSLDTISNIFGNAEVLES